MKCLFTAKLLKIIIINQEKTKSEINFNDKFYENQLFIERLGFHLSKKMKKL